MNVIEQFFIELGIDSKQLKDGMAEAVGTVDSGMKKLVAGFSVGMIANKISQMMGEFTQELSELNKLSKSINVNVEDIGNWQNAVREFGGEADKFGQVFSGVNEGMLNAIQRNRGVLNKYVQQGILPELKDAEGQAKDVQDYMLEIADTLSGMNEREAAQIVKEITGVTDTDTVEFLMQGSAAIRDQMEATKDLTKFTTDDAKAAKDLEKAQSKMAQAVKMTFLPVFRALAPLLTKVTDLFTLMARHIRAFYPAIAAVAAVIGATLLPTLGAAIAAMGAFLLSPVGILLAALVAIGVVLDDLITWINGGESAFADMFEEIFGSKEAAQKAIADIMEAVNTLIDTIVEVGGALWDVVRPIAVALFGLIVENIITAIQWLASMKDTFIEIINAVSEVWKAFVSIFSGDFDGAIEHIKNAFRGFLAIFEEGVKWVLGKIAEIASKIPGLGTLISKFTGGSASAAVPAGATTVNGGDVNMDNKLTLNVAGGITQDSLQSLKETSGDFFTNKMEIAPAVGAYPK